MTDGNKRGYYRIEYPVRVRPSFLTSEETLEVIDCSESGLRYALPEAAPPPEVGAEIRGVVRFREGPEVEVEGVVARIFGGSVAVRFIGAKIPFSTILQEQHHLRRHYLGHLGD